MVIMIQNVTGLSIVPEILPTPKRGKIPMGKFTLRSGPTLLDSLWSCMSVLTHLNPACGPARGQFLYQGLISHTYSATSKMLRWYKQWVSGSVGLLPVSTSKSQSVALIWQKPEIPWSTEYSRLCSRYTDLNSILYFSIRTEHLEIAFTLSR